MIAADFQCPSGHITEAFCHWKQKKIVCKCGKKAKRIITMGGVNTANDTPPWLKSVVDVVDKTSHKSHVREFVKNPNRKTYKAWMKGEGIRPLDHTEHGGPPVYHQPPETDTARVREEVARRHFERKRIEL